MEETTPESTPASPPSSWVNSDGSFGDLSSAPESVRTMAEAKGFKSVNDIADMATNLESMKGDWSNPASMKLPDSLSDDQMAQIRTKMGTPESPDKYVFEGGIDMSDPGIQQFMELSHKAGKTQSTFEKDMEFYQGLIELGNTQEAEAQAVFKESLGDNYDSYIERTNSVADKLGVGPQTDPAILAILDKVAELTTEGTIPSPQAQPQEKSKEEKIAAFQADPAFMNKMDPRHKQVVADYRKLFNIG